MAAAAANNATVQPTPAAPAAPRCKTGEEVDPMREERTGLIREVGCQAIWSLSSCKPGFGVDQLRDPSLENYWQSDGQLPHLVNIQFRRKTTIRDICIYTDFKLDESYTPSKISIRCGTHFNDLQEVEVVEFAEPSGWVQIYLKDIRDRPIRTFMLQLAVLSNHQNGRDTHLRQIRIHSPVENLPVAVFPGNYTSLAFRKSSCIHVSIWLHQSVKGFRDKDGNPIRNSHLLGMFHRVCKLLSHGIKPIFVFDGGVPVLKRQTMATRRQRKIEAQDKSLVSRKKLIQNLLKQQLQRQYLTDLPATEEINNEIDRVVKAGSKNSRKAPDAKNVKSTTKKLSPLKSKGEKDVFEDDFEKFRDKLTQNYNNFSIFFNDLDAKRSASDSEDSEAEEYYEEPAAYDENFDAILKPSFDELPLEVQHEMLYEMQESRKQNSWGKMDQMPKDLKDFSSFQMERLVKRRTVQKKIQSVQQEMGQRHIHLTNFDDLAAFEYDQAPTEESKVIGSKEKGMLYIKSSPVKAVQKSEPTAGTSKAEPQTITIDDYVAGYSSSDDESSTLTEEQQLEKAIQLSLADADGKPECKPTTEQMDGNDPEAEKLLAAAKVYSELLNRSKNDEASITGREKPQNIVECRTTSQPEDITISDSSSSSSDFEEVEAEAEEEEQKPEVELESMLKDSAHSLTIAFDAEDGFKEEEDIFADVFNTQPSAASAVHGKRPGGKEAITAEKKEEEDKGQDAIAVEKQEEEDDLIGEKASPKREDIIIDSDSDFENVEMPEESAPDISKADISEEGPTIARTLGRDPVKSDPVRMISAQYMQAQDKLNRENTELTNSKGFQERVATSITDQMYSEAQELLTLFGVPYIISPMEAEAQCAFLDIACLTEGTVTDDSDVWLFGAQRVYKNFFSAGDRPLQLYEYSDIVQSLNLDREKLVLLAILTGSDYTDGVEGVGPIKALEILSEFPSRTISAFDSLVAFREWWERAQQDKKLDSDNKIRAKFSKLKLRPGFPSQAVYDAYLNPTIDESLEPFRWGTADLDALRSYTKEKFGWNQQKCDAALLPLIKSLRCQAEESTRQLTMDSFIQFGERKGNPKRKKIKSKRLQQAMKKLKGPVNSEVKLSSESESEPEPTPPNLLSKRNEPAASNLVSKRSESTASSLLSKRNESESDDEELDDLLTRMGVKRVRVKRDANSVPRGNQGWGTLQTNSTATSRTPGSTPSSHSSPSNASPSSTSETPSSKVVTPTKKPTVIPQKARAEFQKEMNKEKAIELLQKKKT